MSLVAKLLLLSALLFVKGADARNMNILVLGEGASANCNVRLYGEEPNVFQIGRNGMKRPARDPLDWADCSGGSIWIPVGRQIVEARFADQVAFMSLGMEKSQVRDWVKGGRAFARLESALQVAKAKNIKFDYVFWYQGMSDGVLRQQDYGFGLVKVIRGLIPVVPGARWLIAQSAGCGNAINKDIFAAQRKVSANPLFNRFPGPDVSLLHNSSLSDQCTLREDGQEIMAKQWFRSLVKAEEISRKYEKESLLHYFK
jgi:hypothetical protein